MIITAEEIIACKLCYPERRIRTLVGSGVTPTQIVESEIPLDGKLWLLAQVCAERDCRVLARWAADCAEAVLHLTGASQAVAEAAITAARVWAANPCDATRIAAAAACTAARVTRATYAAAAAAATAADADVDAEAAADAAVAAVNDAAADAGARLRYARNLAALMEAM